MKIKIETSKAPGAIGPYSQAVEFQNMIFTSGQLPIDPESGEIPETINDQTRQSLKNLQSILESADSSMEKVCKTTVFLSDMNNFSAMNEIYEQFFSGSIYPSRSAIEVARLPKDVLVEIEAIAWK